ncbi:hypothetical protein EMH43_27115, partial [Klebsiella pneumoniae]
MRLIPPHRQREICCRIAPAAIWQISNNHSASLFIHPPSTAAAYSPSGSIPSILQGTHRPGETMPLADFHRSDPFTLGIELELQVVNPPGY